LDQEIRDLEAIHQQVERRREKMFRLAELQKKIDEASKEMHTSHKTMNKGISHNRETFIKKTLAMMTYGMTTFINIAFDDASP
jgi:ABC-type Fe3+-citrate transport system substrate-binding protein